MATLFDFHNARIGFHIDVGSEPGSIERNFVNRLSSIVKDACGRESSSEIDNFRLQYLLKEIQTKSLHGRNTNDEETRDNLAIEKTLASNDHCRIYNESASFGPSDKSILARARHIVASILGKFSFGCYEDSAFSSGASTTQKRGLSGAFAKYGALEHGYLEVTPRAASRLYALIDNTPTLRRMYIKRLLSTGEDPIRIVDRDVVKTVPKNSETSRTILIQPAGMNILQKAIGKCIRRKLKAAGIDLSNQSVNQLLARVGSLRRSHATIDLSSASDTVNARIVWELLPPDWYRELEALRCDYGHILDSDGNVKSIVKWEMFSAMGNAFTFELESLIFYAIAVATAESQGSYVGRISVYGDDIIVPNSIAQLVCENLTSCGFKVNTKKTHIDGWFRESCGAHWYRGVCVKPFYIRDDLTRLDSIMRLANQLRKWSSDGYVCDPRFYKLWKYVADHVPAILWGGWDLDSSHSLVTADRPRKRLLPVTAKAQLGGEGALAASFQAYDATSTLHSFTFTAVGDSPGLSDLDSLGNVDFVKTNEDRFYIRRNRPYGRYTSPPTWEIPFPSSCASGKVEHLSH